MSWALGTDIRSCTVGGSPGEDPGLGSRSQVVVLGLGLQQKALG